MKVLVGYFTTESNAHVPMKNNITDYVVAFGDRDESCHLCVGGGLRRD